MKKPAIIIFIKNPELGKAKTRLASTVGDERALAIYKELLRHTRETVLKIENCERHLFYSSFVDKEDDWSNDSFNKKLQPSGDLGNRITTAFEDVFKTNQPVLIVGSDCASLTAEILEEAIESLKIFDFVIGPADDGGYYLIGMNDFQPSVFEDIAWSTEQVLPQTINKIQELGKNFGLLATLSDIDYEEDWKKWGWEF